jgi:hypothetical protein
MIPASRIFSGRSTHHQTILESAVRNKSDIPGILVFEEKRLRPLSATIAADHTTPPGPKFHLA